VGRKTVSWVSCHDQSEEKRSQGAAEKFEPALAVPLIQFLVWGKKQAPRHRFRIAGATGATGIDRSLAA
jgi:hypothetical protein